jgi:hypothetical protein
LLFFINLKGGVGMLGGGLNDKPQIIIEIDEEGNPKIEVKNVVGKSCVDLTEGIEKELGKVEKRVYKLEYYQEEKQEVKNKKKLKLF